MECALISAEDLVSHLKQCLVIDARTPEEYADLLRPAEHSSQLAFSVGRLGSKWHT